MTDVLRALGRALTGMLHPRMLWLTLVPFLIASAIWGAVFWFAWEKLVGWAGAWLGGWSLSSDVTALLAAFGMASLHFVIAPFIVVSVMIPMIAVTALLLIAAFAMPAVVRHLGARQFAGVEARHGGSWWGSLGHSLLVTLIFAVLVVVTLPLWLVPPLFAVVPPLLWGWLAYRVMTYDALAEHASRDERRALVRAHRWPLFGIGVATGLLGSVPTLLWASSVAVIVLFPLIAALAVWLYVWIFVFSALWFAFYCLQALQQLRAAAQTKLGRPLIAG